MPTASLTFSLPEEQEDMERTIAAVEKVRQHETALREIHQQIFRAARKHGYSDQGLKESFDALYDRFSEEEQMKLDSKTPGSFVGLLEDKFFEILKENNLELA